MMVYDAVIQLLYGCMTYGQRETMCVRCMTVYDVIQQLYCCMRSVAV